MLTINLNLILVVVFCYLVGSIPNGYLLTKALHGKDITKEGSGNVGTLNTFQVSRSKMLAGVVLLLDFLKGFLPVVIMLYVVKLSVVDIFFSSCFIIIGHNFSIWLKFKGGRGLASSAGIFIVLNYTLLITWCIVWLLFYAVKRDVLFSNIFATIIIPVVAIVFRRMYISAMLPFMPESSYGYFIIFLLIITFLILYKHRFVFSRFIPLTEKRLNEE